MRWTWKVPSWPLQSRIFQPISDSGLAQTAIKKIGAKLFTICFHRWIDHIPRSNPISGSRSPSRNNFTVLKKALWRKITFCRNLKGLSWKFFSEVLYTIRFISFYSIKNTIWSSRKASPALDSSAGSLRLLMNVEKIGAFFWRIPRVNRRFQARGIRKT